jgi:hypothetical protein
MKRKLQLSALGIGLCLGMAAQTGRVANKSGNIAVIAEGKRQIEKRGCGTETPPASWDAWFNQKVEELNNQQGKNASVANYTIAVVVHIIHGGQAIGTFPNITSAQANSQIGVLNNDFAGTGLNNANAPAPFAPAKANCNIYFCMANKTPSGATMTDPGVDRVDFNTFTLSPSFTQKNPAASVYNTPALFQSFVNSVVKPQTIWDPTRYLNIWVTDEYNSGAPNFTGPNLLGYATFPSGTGLTGITSSFGTATTDGCWLWSRATGSVGTLDPTYNKGRTATHEIGHWLGLRHIGGDGQPNGTGAPVLAGDCSATDYCNDTPPQKGGFAGGQYGQNYGVPTYPLYATGTNSCASAPNGNMFMNFMDYTDDPAMYMFTTDQRTRIQTAMANGTFRSALTANSVTNSVCGAPQPPSAPTASFTSANSACTNSALTTNNLSSGNPTPTYSWSSNPPVGVTFNPNSTATNPSITFATTGVYVLTLVATNSLGTNNTTKTITVNTCTVAPSCPDTLTNFYNTDTLFVIRSGATAPGYVGGNNGYGDLEKAEYYSSTGLVGNSRVAGAIVLFYRHATANIGTKGTSVLTFKMYNGNNTTGPAGAAINTFTAAINTILGSSTATSSVKYCGDPNLAFSTNIIRPYSFNFPSSTLISGDFLVGVKLPTLTGDTAVVFNSGESTHPVSTAWELQSNNVWFQFDDGTTNSWQLKSSLAILPKIVCNSSNVQEQLNSLTNNISILPNPSSGHVQLVFTLTKEETIDITITNALGQVMNKGQYGNVSSNVFDLDLSSYANGVYFVNLNNGKEKTVKRIVISK